MSAYEVPEPILNAPFDEPKAHWHIVEGEEPVQRPGRRPAMYFYRDPKATPEKYAGHEAGTAIELKLVNRIRDTNSVVDAFAKNAGLGFAIPYLHNGQMYDYMPGFVVRRSPEPPRHLIIETKGHDPLKEVKRAAAERWVAAVNADGRYGRWAYAMAKKVADIPSLGSPSCLALVTISSVSSP